MKNLFVSAVMLVALAALALPAAAFENEFGGYWRTRAYTQENYTGTGFRDGSLVDTRTRLYYTAKFSDNFKFVNKFEMDATWGNGALTSYGDIGTDGIAFEVKNSYIDATFDAWNFKIGAQYGKVSRGFLFADDFAGAIVTYDGGSFSVPAMWIKNNESTNFTGGAAKDQNDFDADYYVLSPVVNISDSLSINPVFMMVSSEDGANMQFQGYPTTNFPVDNRTALEEVTLYYLGLDADMDFDMASVWFTGIYQFGSLDYDATIAPAAKDLDVSAYLLAFGGNVDLGTFNVYGEMFTASGESNTADNDYDAYFMPKGQSYYWSEIMGLGMFDLSQVSKNAPGDQISNITALNIGASMSPMDKLTVTADVWYAMLNEESDDSFGGRNYGGDDLGIEIDLMASYKLMDNLTLDFVLAYLLAGDATTGAAEANNANPAKVKQTTDDPYLVGTMLSLSF